MDYAQIFSNGNIAILLLMSFFGGLVASVSPCSLAMLPVIIGYVGGYCDTKPFKTFLQMLAFICGTAIVFSIIGTVCAVTGKVFVSNPYFTLIISSVLMIMGLKLVGFLDFEFPVFIKEMPKINEKFTYLYPFLLGGIFALIGTPCSTPILAGIMAFASLSANILTAIMMLFLFSMGQGLIFIVAGCLTTKVKATDNFYKFSKILMKICGILLILASIFIFYKIFAPFVAN